MNIDIEEIERKIRYKFPTAYKRFASFIDSGYLWDSVVDVINNAEIMKNIIFCNDVMKIPPVKTHIMILGNSLRELDNNEKQALGAIYGFIFKEIFGYSKQESVSCVINTVKTATRFSNGRKVEFNITK